MHDLKVTLVQADQAWEDKSTNLENYEKLLKSVSTDLIILPEMFHTAFTMNADAYAEEIIDSPGINWLQQLAAEKDAAVYTSLIIKENGSNYNRGVFVYPDGKFSVYDKRKTFTLAGEDKFYASGGKETIVDFKGWKIQLQICYDLRFPEISRNKIFSNHSAAYDVLVYVANWPMKRSVHWKSLLQARAIENQCYVIGVNRVGLDANDHVYSGDSRVVDALGEVDELAVNKETVKTIVLNKNKLVKTREILPFLKDR